jgi:hypothetical protein
VNPIGAGLIASVALNAQRRYRGDKPSELPIVQPTKFETAINSEDGKDLGTALSPSMLARTDEVIEQMRQPQSWWRSDR